MVFLLMSFFCLSGNHATSWGFVRLWHDSEIIHSTGGRLPANDSVSSNSLP